MKQVLVLGGAGCRGSDTAYNRIISGDDVVVADQAETGFRKAGHPAARINTGNILNPRLCMEPAQGASQWL